MKSAWFFLAMLFAKAAWATQAQPVPIPEELSLSPQLNISGTGFATGTLGQTAGEAKARPRVDFSDSTLQFGAAQRLYNQSVGSMGVGLLALGDGTAAGTSPFFLSQAFLDFQSEHFEVLVGRSDNATAHLVDFPTLRDDDLFTLTNPLNPYSQGGVAQEHRYANLAQVTINQGLSFYENFHAQQLIDSSGIASGPSVQSYGATFQYLGPAGLSGFTPIASLGAGYEHITLPGWGGLHQLYAGGVINLNESVTHHFDFRVQEVVSLGSELRVLANIRETFEADSHALAGAIRYRHSPFGAPGYQLALTVAHKSYLKIDAAQSVGLALTGIRRLGEGFDLAVQYTSQWRASRLSSAQSSGTAVEQVAQLGFVFNWDATFNRHIPARRSILNQRYHYLPDPPNSRDQASYSRQPLPKKVYVLESDEAGENLVNERGYGERETEVRMMNLMMVGGSGLEGMDHSSHNKK